MAPESAWGSRLAWCLQSAWRAESLRKLIQMRQEDDGWKASKPNVLLGFLDFTFWDPKMGQAQFLPSAVGSLICQGS